MDPAFIYAVITGVFAAGAAFGGVKIALNGTRSKVDDVYKVVSDHIREETHNDKRTHERLAKVETKVDILVERIKQ